MITIVKLTSGETIMGEMPEDTNKENADVAIQSIVNPCQIQIMPSETGAETPFTVSFYPYALFAENHQVFLYKSHIVFVCAPQAPLIEQYKKIFGKDSGLIVPTGAGVTKARIEPVLPS